MKFSEKKNQILKQMFSCTMKIWKEKFPKCQVLNWDFFVPADFENKTFWIINLWRKSNFRKIYFEFNFCSEISFRWKIHISELTFWLNLLRKKNKIFNFRAEFKRHGFEANLFIENQSLKRIFLKKSHPLKQFFFYKLRFWF